MAIILYYEATMPEFISAFRQRTLRKNNENNSIHRVFKNSDVG